jgi:RNA polymerase sigma-70 factor (ECF subfamily)
MALSVDEEEVFLRLVDQHRGIIRKVAAGYTSGVADQHDLGQEILLQLWKAYPRYSPERPFSTWMYRIALNVGISFLRRNTRPVRQTVALDDIVHELPQEPAGSPELDERVALLLLYLDDHSYRDIAAILGITETNVATKLSRLKEQLRQHLTQTKK